MQASSTHTTAAEEPDAPKRSSRPDSRERDILGAPEPEISLGELVALLGGQLIH